MSMSVRNRQRSVEELVYCSRLLREIIQSDPHRPRYHLVAPEGWTNDANGLMYWTGRYHVFILGRTPLPHPEDHAVDNWVGRVWLHASSHDLVHWIHHPAALKADETNTSPDHVGPQSGDAVENAPVPTLIYHDGMRNGACIAISDDPDLIHWTPLPQNPVIPFGSNPEVKVHDPCAWYRDGVYYALIGGKNYRHGHEGDCTSLYRSTNLVDWEYRGPFYRSRREWTDEVEDCACPDFFPLGNRYMLLMHGHQPYSQCHYYLGRLEGERFHPETHGRMTWPGGQFAGPETLLDHHGRRILFGWIPDGDHAGRSWQEKGWASVISLPRLLSLGPDGSLRIMPAPELEILRFNHRRHQDVPLADGADILLDGLRGECLELGVTVTPGAARRVGVKVRCSGDGSDETRIIHDTAAQTLTIHSRRPAEDAATATNAQTAPLAPPDGEPLRLRIFLDRSVLEVFANDRQCMTQRIYPSRSDSDRVGVVSSGGEGAAITALDAWDMHAVAPI